MNVLRLRTCECEYLGWLCVSIVSLNGFCIIVDLCLDTMCERDCRFAWVKYEASRLGASMDLSIFECCR